MIGARLSLMSSARDVFMAMKSSIFPVPGELVRSSLRDSSGAGRISDRAAPDPGGSLWIVVCVL